MGVRVVLREGQVGTAGSNVAKTWWQQDLVALGNTDGCRGLKSPSQLLPALTSPHTATSPKGLQGFAPMTQIVLTSPLHIISDLNNIFVFSS